MRYLTAGIQYQCVVTSSDKNEVRFGGEQYLHCPNIVWRSDFLSPEEVGVRSQSKSWKSLLA